MVNLHPGSLLPSLWENSTRFQSKTKLVASPSRSGRLRKGISCLCQVTVTTEPLQFLKWCYVKRLEVFTTQVRTCRNTTGYT